MPPRQSKPEPRTTTATSYAVHPAYAMLASGRERLEARTGKTLEEWVAITQATGPAGERERIAWLRATHGITTNYAYWIAWIAGGGDDAYDPDALVEAMYAGAKQGLWPIYERLLAEGMSLGDDVTATPCSTFVPLRRRYVFAQIKPATRTRIDLGLALGDAAPTGRLATTGGAAKGDRISHAIAIASLDEVDDEVLGWLRAAYARGNETRLVPAGHVVDAGSALPVDLASALAASAPAQATFDTLTPRMKGEWVAWITEAKKAETRAKRIATAVEKLAAGKKRMY